MKTSKIILSVLTVIISCSLACPVFADWVSGGNWSYGGYHNPVNWGAFSNYFTTIDGIGQVWLEQVTAELM